MTKNQPQKRLPHGVTQALVFDMLCQLSIQKDSMRPVSRAQLLQALPQLSEATIDDRLRTLRALKRIKSEQGKYQPLMPEPKWRIPPMLRGQHTAVAHPEGYIVDVYRR